MGLQTSEPSPPDETKVLPPGFNHFVTCPDRNQPGDVILDDAEDYSSVWESLPASSRPVSGALRPEWEADAELATSFEWQRHLETDKDRDSASGTMPKSPGPGQPHSSIKKNSPKLCIPKQLMLEEKTINHFAMLALKVLLAPWCSVQEPVNHTTSRWTSRPTSTCRMTRAWRTMCPRIPGGCSSI